MSLVIYFEVRSLRKILTNAQMNGTINIVGKVKCIQIISYRKLGLGDQYCAEMQRDNTGKTYRVRRAAAAMI